MQAALSPIKIKSEGKKIYQENKENKSAVII